MAPRTKNSRQQQRQQGHQRSNKKSNKSSRRRSSTEEEDDSSSSSMSYKSMLVLPPALLAAVGFAAYKFGQASVRDLPPIRPTGEEVAPPHAEGAAPAVVADPVDHSSSFPSDASSETASTGDSSPFWTLLCPPNGSGHENNSTSSSSSSLDDDDRYCHPNLHFPLSNLDENLLRVSSDVPPGEKLLAVPRRSQIRDVDALNDDYVKSELLSAEDGENEKEPKLLDTGALLACHLIRRLKVGKREWTTPSDGKDDDAAVDASVDADGGVRIARVEKQEEEDALLLYLQTLPSHSSLLASYHPILFFRLDDDREELPSSFPLRIAIEAFKSKVRTEYETIVVRSQDFASNVKEEEYVAMRINVESLSFPLEENDCLRDAEGRESIEAYAYRDAEGSPGLRCLAMVPPSLGAASRHDASSSSPNAEWEYSGEDGSFAIKTKSDGIRAGGSLVLPDGSDKTTDLTSADLYAIQGRIPGSGSRLPSSASIAARHTIHPDSREVTEEQSKQLMEYLRYDDGYVACLDPKELKGDEMRVLTLKKLKHKHLKRIANDVSRWTVVFPPVATDKEEDAVGPHPAPPTYTAQEIEELTEGVTSTCRLLSLTHEDYDGHAVKILEAVLSQNDADRAFAVGRQTNALEFRTMVCLSRLVEGAMEKYPRTAAQERKHVQSFVKHNSHTPEFFAAQLRLSELQILESLRYAWGLAGQEAKEKAKDEPPNPIPDTWRELIDPKSGWQYYQRLTSPTGTWIRPVFTAREMYEKQQREARGEKQALPDPTQSISEKNKPKSAKRPDLLARRKPCDADLTIDVIATKK